MIIKTTDSVVNTRVATLEDVELLLRWAGDEGWNPGLDDARLFYAADATGFLVTTIDEKIVAGISLVKYTSAQAFLGLYLCLPGYRGKGYGMATWSRALDAIEKHTVGLDGVADQQDNYRQSGFVYCFGNRRFQGVLAIQDDHPLLSGAAGEVSVAEATANNVGAIIDYDADVGGFERIRFFQAWMQACDSRSAFIALQAGRVVGVIGLRKCLEGYKVGPWLADSQSIATQLLHASSAVTKNQTVMIDIPEVNVLSIQIAESLSLQPVFDTARMYKGEGPVIDERRLFGVATLELG
ncbi:MAG: GNAT family N-acetyltransferase [Granulosicoccus sp.]